ncbi:MAG TPA: hypothetical protein VMF13_19915, partial [Luteitalea sp.]|nr:hypothetical protein [Luteitalea sp.]
MSQSLLRRALIALAWSCLPSLAAAADLVDLSRATIVVRPDPRPAAEKAAADVLVEELGRRLGTTLSIAKGASDTPVSIAVVSGVAAGEGAAWAGADAVVPSLAPAARRPEGYQVSVERVGARTRVWVIGADGRGALFGAGALLRALHWTPGATTGTRGILADLAISSSPAYPIRGHQLGYRQHSNTYDAWDEARYDRHIRELALFGANSIENIPLQDTRVSPHFPVSREVMNVAVSRICARYELDYWIWTPADYDLADVPLRASTLDRLDAMFAAMPRLDAVFVPGGDPGHNAATLVLPYLADLGARLRKHHPNAQVWLSLQWFSKDQIDWIYTQVNGKDLPWFGGLVAGPSSPGLAETRSRLDRRYRLRDYPDITHTVRSQYVVPDWDPAYNFTLGREPINPRPVFYSALHDRIAAHTDGFISYSDGVNDDVNKAVWSAKAWAPEQSPRTILTEYARLFFGAPVAERAADGLLALERNWQGDLATNGSVDGTLSAWQRIESEFPQLEREWRWQQAIFRAYYDAWTRHRLLSEVAIERQANAVLLTARQAGAAAVGGQAKAILASADLAGPRDAWHDRLESLGGALFRSIGMQLDTPNYKASGRERGAVLDFIRYPLNNRWWMEDEIDKALALPNEAARVDRLLTIGRWETPGPGSFYDDIGHVGRSPHVVQAEPSLDSPGLQVGPTPHFTWEQEGRTRTRQTWLTSLRWPLALAYDTVDRQAAYTLRLNGNGDIKVRINGEQVTARKYGTVLGEPKEYVVPATAVQSGRVRVTFDEIDESDR